MVWEQNVQIIIMLCNKKVKIEFWVDSIDSMKLYGKIHKHGLNHTSKIITP